MLTVRRFAMGACAVALPLILLASVAGAESSSSSSTSSGKTDQSACPQTAQQLSAAAQECQAKGMGASVTRNATTGCGEFNGCTKSDRTETAASAAGNSSETTSTSSPSCPMTQQQIASAMAECAAKKLRSNVTRDPVTKCYTFNGCSQSDRRETTPTTTPASTTACPTSMQEVSKNAQDCNAKGMRANVKKEGGCYTFAGCVQRSETEHSQTTTSLPTGTCTETKEGGCTKIVCADGFRFNSCEMAAICKQMTTTAKPMPMPLPPVPSTTNTMKSPCSDSEAGLQYAYDKFLVNPGDANVQKVVNDLKTKLNDCRIKNTGQTTSPGATTNGTRASCTVVKNNDTGCMEKRCDNAVVAKSCPGSGSLSSVHS